MSAVLSVQTKARNEFIDITDRVREELRRLGKLSGVCTIFVPHTTAAVTINENADPTVTSDMIKTLDRLIPRDAAYAHTEGNSDSHLKASLIGASISVPVNDGALELGTWQGIYLCEFDGPRLRTVAITMMAR